jgi:hypothetical protein
MDWINDHFWMVMSIGIVVVIVLVGVLLFLRNQRPD